MNHIPYYQLLLPLFLPLMIQQMYLFLFQFYTIFLLG